MLILIVVLIAVAAIVLVSAGFVVAGRRRGRLRPPRPDREVAPPAPGVAPASVPIPTPAGPAADSKVPEAHRDPVLEALPAAEAPPDTGAPPDTVTAPAPLAPPTAAPPAGAPPETAGTQDIVEAPEESPRIRDRLGRTRSLLAGYLTSMRSRDRIDEATWEELEEALILADVGAGLTARILDDLRARVKQEGINSPDDLVVALKGELVAILQGDRELHLAPDTTNVWLFVGVNGVGKTTTIGKLGLRHVREGHRVVMAAGDTFRAAAADQLEVWAERVGASIIRGNEGGDPGAVVFDAVQHAAARHADLVLADTAGRLHTKTNLMEELKKVRRVAERPPGTVSEVLLVIDATTGQNGLIQAQQFAAATGVTGIVLTKLDGTAKGGIALAIRAQLGIPIKLVGLGEGVDDLVDFDATEFVEALISG
jgi:fused signal recognition particle receptor